MTPEQKNWLKTNFGIDVDNLKKSPSKATRKVGEHFVDFYKEKEKSLEMIREISSNPNSLGIALELQSQVEQAEADLMHAGEQHKGQDKEHQKLLDKDLEQAKQTLKQAEKTASHVKTHLDDFMKIRGRIHENLLKLRVAANKYGSDIKTIEANLSATTIQFRSNDFEGAIKELKSLESSSKELLKSADQFVREKQKFDELAQKVRQEFEILKVTPFVDLEPMETMLLTASLSVKALEYKDAYDALNDHTKVYETALKAAKEEQKRVNENEAASDLVINKLDELDLFFEKIAELPGLGKWISDHLISLSPCQIQASKGEYESAWKVLNSSTWTVSKLQEEAVKLSTQQSEKGLKQYPNVKLVYGNCKSALDELKRVATEVEHLKTVGLVNKDMDLFLNVVNAKQSLSALMDAAAEDCEKALGKWDSDLKLRNDTLKVAMTDCDQQVKNIINLLDRLKPLAHKDDVAIFEFQWKQLQGGLSLREYEKIQEGLRRLVQDLQKFDDAFTKSSEEWDNKFKLDGGDLAQSFRKIANCPVTAGSEKELQKEWEAIQALAKGKQPEQALERLVSLESEVFQLLDQVDVRNKNNDAIVDADKKMQTIFDELTVMVSTLKKSLSTMRNKEDSHAQEIETPIAIESALQGLKGAWSDNISAALQVEDLGLNEYEKQCKNLREKLESVQSNPEAMNGLVAKQVLAEGKQILDSKEEEARQALDSLMELDSTEAIRKKKLVDAISANASKDYQVASDEMERRIVEINSTIEFRQQVVKQYREVVNRAYANALQRVNEAKKNLSRELRNQFDKYFSTVNAEIEDIKKSTITTSNLGALEACVSYFDDIVKRMAEFVESQKQSPNVFRQVMVALSELADSEHVGNENLETCLPSKKAMFDEKLKGYQTSVLSLDPNESLVQLKTFSDEVSKAVNDAQFAYSQRNTFKQNKKTALVKLKSLPKELEYRASLQSKMDALEAKVNTEGKESVAMNGLATLLVEMDRAINDPEFRNAKNKDVINSRIETEKKKQLWESQLSKFETLFDEAKKALKIPEADVNQQKELEKMKSEAKKSAKSLDYGLALKQIGLAIEHAKDVIKSPLGEKVTSRNNLPKDLNRYQSAVRALNSTLRSIGQSILEEVGKSVDPEVGKTASALLDQLTYQFDMEILSTEVGLLSEKGGELSKRRAAKEKALAKIRDYQKILDGDPLLFQVLMNPFSLDARASLDSLRTSLNSLDVNLRRCV